MSWVQRLVRVPWLPNALATGSACVFILASGFVIQSFLWHYTLQHTAQERLENLDHDSYYIKARLRSRANDLFFLKQVAEDELGRNPAAPLNNANLRSAISTMMIARSLYEEVWLLDPQGREMFRYKWLDSQQPLVETSENALQDESVQNAYQQTLEATTATAVYSPIRLLSGGDSAKSSVLPVSGQIITPDGHLRAVLVMNYFTDHLFRDLRKMFDKPWKTFLFDSNGFCLLDSDPSQTETVGSGSKERGLKLENPSLWTKISQRKSGWFLENGYFYCFYQVDPSVNDSENTPIHTSIQGWEKLHFIILEKESEKNIWKSLQPLQIIRWLSCLGSMAIFGPLMWFGILTIQRRRLVTQELRKSQILLLDALNQQRNATKRAQDAELSKGEFLANMSHEIRTPMNAVIGLSHLALEQELPEKVRDYLNKIHDSSKALLSILNDILDYSKLEAGYLELECEAFSLPELLKKVTNLFAIQASEKELKLTFIVKPNVPKKVYGDATRLGQVLINLGGNAVKFTEHGEIAFQVEEVGRENGCSTLQFMISDTGIGMTEEQVARLFKPFSQADSSINRRYGGTGLGLRISQQLVEKMGGRILVQSEPGRGSQFFFTLRLPLIEKKTTILPDAGQRELDEAGLKELLAKLRDAKILLVEDNPINQQVAREVLERDGFRVTLARDGQEGIWESQAQSFDLIFMDIHMPGMNGYEATRQIRQLAGYEQIPIIAMTAAVLEKDRAACLAAGMNDHIAKPLISRDLQRVLLKWIKPLQKKTTGIPLMTNGINSPHQELPGFNLADAMERMGLSEESLLQTLKDSRESFAEDAELMLQKIDQGKHREAISLAHRIKGGASTLGAVALAEAAAHLESQLEGNPNEINLESFRQTLHETLKVLASLS